MHVPTQPSVVSDATQNVAPSPLILLLYDETNKHGLVLPQLPSTAPCTLHGSLVAAMFYELQCNANIVRHGALLSTDAKTTGECNLLYYDMMRLLLIIARTDERLKADPAASSRACRRFRTSKAAGSS